MLTPGELLRDSRLRDLSTARGPFMSGSESGETRLGVGGKVIGVVGVTG